jgi:hypothetical protein
VYKYKVGDEAERQVYILGKAPDGRWAAKAGATAVTARASTSS